MLLDKYFAQKNGHLELQSVQFDETVSFIQAKNVFDLWDLPRAEAQKLQRLLSYFTFFTKITWNQWQRKSNQTDEARILFREKDKVQLCKPLVHSVKT